MEAYYWADGAWRYVSDASSPLTAAAKTAAAMVVVGERERRGHSNGMQVGYNSALGARPTRNANHIHPTIFGHI